MKKLFPCLLAVVVCLVLASCASTNPYGEDNPYLYGIGDSGDYVFTTTDADTASYFVDLGPLDYSRVTGCMDPLTGYMYGAIEGSFRKSTVNTALGLSGQFEKVKGSITFYRHKDSQMEVYVPANGIILFASSDVAGIYDKTYRNPDRNETYLSDSIFGSSVGVYVQSPVVLPDLGYDLGSSAVERFDFILITSDAVRYDIEFGLASAEYADSFFTLLKGSYVTNLRESGQKVDLKYLKTIILMEDRSVFLKDQEYSTELLSSIL